MPEIPSESESVLSFWFGPPQAGGRVDAEQRARWFRKDPVFDRQVAERWAALHARAAAGQCDDWLATPRGALALVVLLDQLSRNMYRGEAAAFAQDARALAAATRAIDLGFDRRLAPDERTFMYMPLMHSEDLAVQERCVMLFAAWAEDLSGADVKAVSEGLDYARQHRDIIQRFGRFPHRNAILGRPSTPEEEAFLAGPGSSF
jgi:uncharacterized protein (DUF924 family)